MKHLYKIWLYVVVLAIATSCADNDPLGFLVDEPTSLISQDSINAYKALKTYVDTVNTPKFKLGVGVSISDYISKGIIYRLVNSNFKEISLPNGMNHGAIVQSDGSFYPDTMTSFLSVANASGVSVFGGPLCWSRGQNATYLNSLIAPLIVIPPAYANSLDLTGLKNSTLNGWGTLGSVSVGSGAGMVNSTNAVKMVASSSSSAATDLQLITPNISVISGHTYEVILYIKSDVAGEGRLAFEGLSNNIPLKDWMNTGSKTATFKTGISWKQVKCQIRDFTGSSIKVHLDLGYKPNVTYYIDVNNLYVYDTQGAPSIVNLVSNGDFETGNINGWGGWGNNSTRTISAKGEGYGGTGYALKVYNPSKTSAFYGVQFVYTLASIPENATQYTLSFDVKADNTGIIRPVLQSPDYGSNGFGSITLTTQWTHYELTTTTTTATRNQLNISCGEMAGTLYLDNVKVYKTAGASLVNLTVEKSAAEKKQYIGDALKGWVSSIVPKCVSSINAWDVVKDPLSDVSPFNVKSGVGQTQASDEFYWQDYLGGKDYAAQTFKLARQYGNASDLLFISDNNLENTDKCNALISFVSYIENQGTKVDGFSTQMHIDLSTDKINIAKMFELLAATGKLVRISELYVNINSSSPTSALLQQQAEMYKYVVQTYCQKVPVAQRYGITVWNCTDSNKGLWNSSKSYVRKPAYAKFADGLSAK